MFSMSKTIQIKLFAILCFLGTCLMQVDNLQAQQDTIANAGGGADPAALAKGKELWEGNCTSCHGLGDEAVIGPGLKGILERRTIDWLIPWIKNSQAVIASGDPYAKALYEKYNKAVMTSFAFSDDEIKSIFAYVKVESEKAVAKPDDTNKVVVDPQNPENLSGSFNLLLGVLLLVLVLIFAVLVLMMSVLTRFLKQKEDLSEIDAEVVNQKFEPFKIFQSRVFLGGVGLIFALVLMKAGLDSLIGVGIQQGYAPQQPIAFSHKLHAGQYEIDCGYCHTGVYKGKSATIPSANICMNCHNAIKRESPEIKKIYAAIENDTPIEWVRIHNLPDLAYFNHAQHTNVAGLACTKCHGEIQQMEVVEQRAPLTMGWCINCHRETVVDHAKDNAYYDNLLKAHSENSKKPMTVENIGGLECSKCHY